MALSVTFSILLTISYFCSVLSRCCSAAVVAKAVFYSFVILRVRISPEGGALRYRYGFMSRLTLHGLLVSYGPLRKIKEKRKGREEQAKSVLPTFLWEEGQSMTARRTRTVHNRPLAATC